MIELLNRLNNSRNASTSLTETVTISSIRKSETDHNIQNLVRKIRKEMEYENRHGELRARRVTSSKV